MPEMEEGENKQQTIKGKENPAERNKAKIDISGKKVKKRISLTVNKEENRNHQQH
jgi:hypothetical protein